MEIIIKFYDTCSLLLAGESAFENDEKFIISSITLKELERIKTAANKDSDVKYSARLLLHLFEKYPNNYSVKIHQTNYEYILDKMNFDINDDARILSDAWNEFETNKCLEFITNDLSYMKKPLKDNCVYSEFSLEDRIVKKGKMFWSKNASKGTMKNCEEPIILNDSYNINWKCYSKLDNENTGTFIYVINEIKNN